MAQVTMNLDEWNQHLAEKSRLADDCDRFQRQLDLVRATAMQDAGVNIARLESLVRSALTLATFAAGNLPPEMTPNWPLAALLDVTNNLDALPTFGSRDDELRIELIALADDIAQHNRRRATARAAASETAPPS
jgi:hypothetical protein